MPLVVLRIALGRAVKWGTLSRNVAGLADPPKAPRTAIVPLSLDETRTFLAAVAEDRLYPLYVLALTTGLREGELLGLAWSDVDLGHRQARIHQQLQRQDGRLQLVDTKTSASRHTVTLAEMAVAALQAHRERQMFARRAAGKRWQDSGLVITTGLGTPLEPRNAVRSFKAALKRAGLPDRRFHDLRHSCATLLLAEGVPLKVVSEMLGHSTIRLTADTYSHVMPALQQAASDRFDILLGRQRAVETPAQQTS
jgi:integrase